MATVTLTGIKKSFGKVDVIHGISLDIAQGEFVALVGPSGCGKFTLLRMIAGLEDPTGGEIAIGGKVVNDALPKDREIAMVFQSYALYPHMTVRENMSFALDLEKRPKAEIDAAVNEASASALPWAARLCVTQKCSFLTSRSRTLMRNCARRCAKK